MSLTLLRIFIFTFLPLLIASGHIALDKTVSTPERKRELFFLYLLGLGVGANGLSGFIGHVFFSDMVADSIGWPAGNPFQLEVGFANLALGILGIIAMARRDGFREATVVAVTVFSVGATLVHLLDIFATGNLAPGNTLQNISNLLRPALLIGFLVAIRKLDPSTEYAQCDPWQATRAQAAGYMAGSIATGFGIGFATGWPVIGTAVGILIGVGVAILIISRATPWPNN